MMDLSNNMIDFRNNQLALCPYCPNTAICLGRGWRPLSIRIDFEHRTDDIVGIDGEKLHVYHGEKRCFIECEPHEPSRGPGWRPKAIKFDLAQEELYGDGPES